MRKLLLAVALLGLAGSANAAPYFRVYGYDYDAHSFSAEAFAHPHLWAGALIDPSDLSKSEGGSLLPLVTHSPKDGCLMPAIVCESWSPLAVGGSMYAGKITFDVAPLWNVIPAWVSLLRPVAPARFQPLLADAPSAVTFSAGPVWQYRQVENKGYLKIFTGIALAF